jgi:flagellar biosynthesis anti-sigma factor FlgM
MDMRIANAYNAFSVYNVKNTPAAKKQAAQERVNAAADTFTLSNEVADYQTARKAVAAVPDVREEKVAYFRSRLAEGSYDVNGNEIAKKLFQGWNG